MSLFWWRVYLTVWIEAFLFFGTPFQTYYHDWVDCGQVPRHRDARNGMGKREDGKYDR